DANTNKIIDLMHSQANLYHMETTLVPFSNNIIRILKAFDTSNNSPKSLVLCDVDFRSTATSTILKALIPLKNIRYLAIQLSQGLEIASAYQSSTLFNNLECFKYQERAPSALFHLILQA